MKQQVIKPLVISILISTIISGICMFLGYLIGQSKLKEFINFEMVFALYLVFLIFVFIILSIKAEKEKKKKKNIKVKDRIEKINKNKEETKDVDAKYQEINKKLKRRTIKLIIILIIEYIFFITLGCSNKTLEVKEMITFIVLLFLPIDIIYSIISKYFPKIEHKNKKYEYLEKIVNKCKSYFNIEEEVKLIFEPNFDINIKYFNDEIYLTIGIYILSILSDIELENALIHEMAHVKNGDVKISNDILKKMYIPSFHKMLLFEDFKLNEEIEMFMLFIRLDKEKNADRAILEYGDKQIYINALAKSVVNIFQDDFRNNINIYKKEELPKDIVGYYLNAKIKNYLENKEMYDYFLNNALERKYDTHPSFKERMKDLNVDHFDINFENNQSEELKKEIEEIKKQINQNENLNYVTVWTDEHNYYLTLVKTYEELINKDFDTLELSDKLKFSYSVLNVKGLKEALVYYSKILEKEKNENALYFKCIIEYGLNMEECLKDIDECLKLNISYYEILNNIKGMYINNNGRTDLIEDYRTESSDKLEELETINLYQEKHKINTYEKHDLDSETINKIKEKVKEFDQIQSAYVIKQKLNENSCHYILGVVYHKNADVDEAQKINEKMQDFTATLTNIYFDDFTYSIFSKKIIKLTKSENLKK